MGTSVLHIKTEVKCRVYLFDEEKGIAKPGTWFNLEVRKGEQDLLFVSTEDETIRCQLLFLIEENDCDYRLSLERSQFKQDSIVVNTTKATDEEIANGVKDEYGVVYSADGKELMRYSNESLKSYQVKEGCIVIRGSAFVSDIFSPLSIKTIILPASLTHIGDNAFEGCKNLTDISLPATLTHIGARAFCYCVNLTANTLPASLTHIGDSAFEGCESLNAITLPASLTHIGDRVFKYCKNLTDIIIPASITHIGDEAFWGCNNLTEISLPSSLTQIGARAFACSGIRSVVSNSPHFTFQDGCLIDVHGKSLIAFLSNDKSVTLSSSLKRIGDWAFCYCDNLTFITLSSTLTSIGHGAFTGCKNLIIITLPANLTSIGDCSFWGCENLTAITLPTNLTHIGDSAFVGSAIRSVVNHSPHFEFQEGCLIDVQGKRLIAFLSDDKEVTLPANLMHIGNRAFYGCKNLSDITLPATLTQIGREAFCLCKNLTSITLPACLTQIGNSAFWGCENLTTITLPANLTSIEDRSFWGCENLTAITLPANVTYIGDSAFSGCENLCAISLPAKLTYIGDSAFSGCKNLCAISLPASLSHLGDDAFYFCDNLTTIYLPQGMRDHFQTILPAYLHSLLEELGPEDWEKTAMFLRKAAKQGNAKALEELHYGFPNDSDESDEYGAHYGEYAGTYAQDYTGYSDDEIDDAFEGDPDAYWNID